MTQSSPENIAKDQSPPLAPETSPAEGESRRHAGRRLLVIGALIIVAVAGAMAAGALPRLWQQQKLDAAATKDAAQPPRVTGAVAQRMAPTAERILPGPEQNCRAAARS